MLSLITQNMGLSLQDAQNVVTTDIIMAVAMFGVQKNENFGCGIVMIA